jgi:hypothetical protein
MGEGARGQGVEMKKKGRKRGGQGKEREGRREKDGLMEMGMVVGERERERERERALRARTNLSGFALAFAPSALRGEVSARQAEEGRQEGGHDSALTLPKPSETIAGVLTRPISTLPCPILQRSVT